MAIKVFNSKTGQWEIQASTVATGISVIDVASKYNSNNVEGCLNEIATDISTIKGDITYLYEHGGGGDGGHGGSTTPLVTIDGSTNRTVRSDETIDIYYYFTSPNLGNGIVTLSYGNTSKNVSIPQGRNKWTVGPFAKGSYTLTILVQDSQGFWSSAVQVTVISGSLEISSSFVDTNDFTLEDDITINYNITTLVSDAVFLDYWYNNAKTTVAANIGANQLHIGKLPFMGVSTLKLQAHNSTYTSNVLSYTLVAANSTTLYTSTTFATESNLEVGKNLLLDYRVSMKNQYSFNTTYFVDGVKIADVVSKPGVNYWNVGNALSIGSHTFKIVTATVDGTQISTLELKVNIVAAGYTPWDHVKTNLIAEFTASGKLNNSLTKNIWEDTSGNNVACDLYNFNYSTNGWLDNSLKTSGKSYAVINLSPFAQGIKEGFTFEIVFKTNCVGDVDAKTVQCKNPVTPFQGFEINTWQAKMTSKASDTVQAQIQDDTWTKISYVVNRTDKTMIMYINGVISSVTYLSPNDPTMANYQDEFSYDGKIYIGAGINSTLNAVNNSVSNIKSIRIYDRALTDTEVLQNFIADETDRETQLALRALNTLSDGLPTLNIVGNFNQMDEDTERQATVTYNDPADPSKTFSKDYCVISWQGTSSKTYPVKNWTVKLKDGGRSWLTYAPKDEWKPEERWTIKANYMDSSGSNNIGINKFIRDFFEPYPYPCEVVDTTTRPNVDGFPINLMINGEFAGIHTWNIDRYAPNNYGFVTYNADGTITRNANAVSYEIAVNSTSGAGAFKDTSWDSIRTEFKHRYNYRETSGAVTEVIKVNNVDTEVLKTGMHNELVDLITWVCNCTDEQFISELDEHFSIRHLIDYYLIAYVLGMVDNLGKNMVLSTWGKDTNGNTIWYPAFYDCDSVMGLNNTGYISFDAGLDMLNGDYNTSNSNLWTKLVKLFGKQVSDRYNELRLTRTVNGATLPPIFSYENIMSYLGDEVIDKVGQKFYNEDARLKYINDAGKSWIFMCNGTRREFTERWLKERFVYMDSVYEFNFTSKAVIRSNIQGLVSLKLKTYSPQWIKISFTDSATDKVKLQVGKSYWTEFSKMINNATDNNIEIYGVNNVMYIDGIKGLNAGSINISEAEKLIELDISNSTRITSLSLGTNSYLTRLLCNDCSNLGYQVTNRTLDVSSCTNLKEFDCSNTHIAQVKFNDVGGVLEKLSCSNTDITTFALTGQEYLPTINLNGCKDLSSLTISNCNGLTSITMSDTNLNSVSITGCNNLNYLDLSRTKYLTAFDISGCPGLKTLIMAGVSNAALTELNLSYAPVLEYLDISSSAYIQTLTFPQFPVTYTTEKTVMTNGVAIIPKKFVDRTSVSVRLTDIGTALSSSTDYTLTVDETTGYTVVTRKATGTIPSGQKYVYVTYNHNSCLTTLKCDNSAIKALRYGRSAAIPAYLDLGGLPLTSANFYSCTNLVEVRNINFVATTSSSIFNNCYNLVTITGKLTLRDAITRAFYNCQKLVNWPILDLANVTSASETFAGCLKISAVQAYTILQSFSSKFTSQWRFFIGCTGITGAFFTTYPDMFSKCTGLTTLSEFFSNCTGITGSIPATLLQPMGTSLTSLYYTFASTNISGEIPIDFLRYNTNLTDTQATFYNTKISYAYLSNLLRYNTKLTSTVSMFNACPNLVLSLDENMFLYNKELVDISGMFANSPNITGSIPQNIFNNIPLTTSSGITSNKLRGMTSLFQNTKITGNIPAANVNTGVKGLLDNCYYLEAAENLFYNCVNLDGSIPTDLFKYNNQLTRISGTFAGCSKLTGPIPPQLLKGKTKITTTNALFSGCSGLQSTDANSIPEGFLDDCILLQDAAYMFSGCSKLTGQIPARVSTWTTKQNVAISRRCIFDIENPVLPSLTVRLNSAGLYLSNSQDYSAIVDNFGRIVISVLDTGTIPISQSSLYVGLLHTVAMTGGIATIPIANIDLSSLTVKLNTDSSTTYILDTDYNVVTGPSGYVVITRTANSSIPETQPTLAVKYNCTAAVDRNAIIDTLNVDLGTLAVRLTESGTALKINTDYTTILNNKTGYIEINRTATGTIPNDQSNLVVTYTHTDKDIIERNLIINKIDSPSMISRKETVTKYGLIDNCSSLVNVGYMFNGCSALGSTIPPKLFISGDKITNMTNMFNDCHYLSGPVPKGLFDNCRSLITTYGMFVDCVSLKNEVIAGETTYFIPPGLFDNCLNLTSVSYMFTMWGSNPHLSYLNGQIPPDLFKNNMKLSDISYFLASAGTITGPVDGNLFKNNTALVTADYAFYAIPITSIGEQLFRTCVNLRNMQYTFYGCSSLTGYAPAYWEADHPVNITTCTKCFGNDTGLTNYATIPTNWK